MISLYIFQTWVQNWPMHRQLWFPLILLIISSVFNIALVERWNIKWGIPDTIFI
eukprot:UN23641